MAMSDNKYGMIVLGLLSAAFAGGYVLAKLLFLLTGDPSISASVVSVLVLVGFVTSVNYLPFTYPGIRVYKSRRGIITKMLCIAFASNSCMVIRPPPIAWQVGIVAATICWAAIVVPDYWRRRGEYDKRNESSEPGIGEQPPDA